MEDKELIAKLHNCREIRPDSAWMAGNRELLLSQISNAGAQELSPWRRFVISFSSLAATAARPAYALGAFVLILFGASLFSHQLFSGAKPNESMYIARIISEKAKLNTVMDSQERNLLAAQFATEHAQDISAVLADPSFNQPKNEAQVAKLNASFNDEIATVKSRMDEIAPAASSKAASPAAAPSPAVTAASIAKAPVTKPAATGTAPKDDNVSIASGKEDNKGIEVSSNPKPEVSTSTAEAVKPDAAQIVNQAQQLFDKKDYSAAADKLKEADELIKK